VPTEPSRPLRYLSLAEVLDIHGRVVAQAGGTQGVRDLGALESAVAQPRASFGGEDLYRDVAAKAAALGHALIANHPFLDGNKRAGHAAMEVFLVLNGFELAPDVDEAERVILDVAAGRFSRERLAEWVRAHLRPT
jgi:death-on-curing protein